MSVNINSIISHINRNFFLKPWNYEVRIFGGGSVPDASPEVMFNCSAINVPGVNLGFTQNKRHGIGPYRNYPNNKSFTELNMTMYESEYERERQYFVEWMDKIYDKKTKRFNFYKEYTKTVNIIQYDKKGNKTYECNVIEAFPSNTSPLDKAYSAGDIVPQFNVNIQFFEVNEIFFDKQNGFRLFPE